MEEFNKNEGVEEELEIELNEDDDPAFYEGENKLLL